MGLELVGQTVGPYRIDALVGVGGMGEVYRARDTKLHRDVAIKVLPRAFTDDSERVARFRREARALAALNHPHVGAIYGFEEIDGVSFLVLELVDGSTLAERINKGPMAMADVLSIARQLAEALDAAHQAGIIHRDLKPANVKVTSGGQVKVLDFGIAKVEPTAASGDTETLLRSTVGTEDGAIIGTPAYMSPEQARGLPVDKRTDIWSFGCIVYEMLTRREAFPGKTTSDRLAAIIEREPDWTALPPQTPESVMRLLRRCLQKDPTKRLRDIGDVCADLDDKSVSSGARTDSGRKTAAVVRFAAVLAAVSVLTALATVTVIEFTRTTPSVEPVARLTLVPPTDHPLAPSGADRTFAISPDGSRLVYRSGSDGVLMVRAIAGLEATRLGNVTGARHPFFSPDGQWVGFFVGVSQTELKKISVNGGPAISLCSARGGARGATWGRDDTIVFSTYPGQLLSVPASGGQPAILTTPDAARGETGHFYPSFLPDGKSLLFTIATVGNPSIDGQIAALDLTTGRHKILLNGGTQPEYIASGHLVYGSGGALRAIHFNPRSLEVSGAPVAVVEHVATLGGTGAVEYDVSATGTLVYLDGGLAGASRTLVWVDRQGHEEPIGVPPRNYSYVRLSPDGTRAALDIRDREDDIWIWDFTRKTLTQLTTPAGLDTMPVWTPNGERVIFSSSRSGTPGLFWQRADRSGEAERVIGDSTGASPWSISPDGTHLIVGSSGRIGVVRVGGTTSAPGSSSSSIDFLSVPAGPRAVLSPDGRWLAIEQGADIYVRPFPGVGDRSWQITTTGGTRPVWSRQGDELFHMDPAGAMVATAVRVVPRFEVGATTKLFQGQYVAMGSGHSYDVAKDRRFLMIKDAALDAIARHPTVVLNWTAELRRLVPTK